MVLISESIMCTGERRTPNNVHLCLTLRGALQSQANVLSLFKQAERRLSVSKWHPIMAHMDDGGGIQRKEQQMKTATPMLQIHRMVKPSIEAPGVFTE
jgi:hypothetical protein